MIRDMPFDDTDQHVESFVLLFPLLTEFGNSLTVFFLQLFNPIKPFVLPVKPLFMVARHLALGANDFHQRGELSSGFFAARLLYAPCLYKFGYRFNDGFNLVVDSPFKVITAHFSLTSVQLALQSPEGARREHVLRIQPQRLLIVIDRLEVTALGFINATEIEVRVKVSLVTRGHQRAPQPGGRTPQVALLNQVSADVVI